LHRLKQVAKALPAKAVSDCELTAVLLLYEMPLSGYFGDKDWSPVLWVLRVEVFSHLGVREPSFPLDFDECEAILRFQAINTDKEIWVVETTRRLG
jgi:hypothetical protein